MAEMKEELEENTNCLRDEVEKLKLIIERGDKIANNQGPTEGEQPET